MEINLSKYSPISLFIYFANAFTATFCSHVTAQSTAEWSQSRSPSNLVSGHVSTMWLIVCTPPHWHLSDDVMCHLWRLAAQRPCPVRKRFNIDDAERPRLKPGSRIVGSAMRFLLATETDCLPLGWMKCRLETGQTKSAFWMTDEAVGGRRSPGTLGWFSTICSSLSHAAFHHMLGGHRDTHTPALYRTRINNKQQERSITDTASQLQHL